MTQTAVVRIRHAFGCNRIGSEFIDKVRDVVGLYLAPPERVMVHYVDEKTLVQAT